ncbi:MAG: hypothetical protein ABJD55_13990, partial [Flavobacteriaceae bacterium]
GLVFSRLMVTFHHNQGGMGGGRLPITINAAMPTFFFFWPFFFSAVATERSMHGQVLSYLLPVLVPVCPVKPHHESCLFVLPHAKCTDEHNRAFHARDQKILDL